MSEKGWSSSLPAILSFIGLLISLYFNYQQNRQNLGLERELSETKIELEKQKLCLSRSQYLFENINRNKKLLKFQDEITKALINGKCDELDQLVEKFDAIAVREDPERTPPPVVQPGPNQEIKEGQLQVFLGHKWFEMTNYEEYNRRVVLSFRAPEKVDFIEVNWDDGAGLIKYNEEQLKSKRVDGNYLYSFENWYFTYYEEPREIKGEVHFINRTVKEFSRSIIINN